MSAIDVLVSIDMSGWDKLEANLAEELHRAIEQLADEAVETAKQRAPVDTGALRDSIGAIVEGTDALFYAEVHYAFFVEFGTQYMAPQPFLMPAIDEMQTKLNEHMRQAIEDAVN